MASPDLGFLYDSEGLHRINEGCCDQIRNLMLENMKNELESTFGWVEEGDDVPTFGLNMNPEEVPYWAENLRNGIEYASCEELLEEWGNGHAKNGKTYNEIYNDCANAQMLGQHDDIMAGEPMSPIDLAFAVLKDIGEIYREGEIPRSQVVEDPQTPAQNLWSSMAHDWREHLADTEQCCRRAKKEYMDAIAGTHIDQWDDIAVGEQWSNESRGRSNRPLPSDIESMDCAEFESMIQNQLSSLDGSENAGPYHFSRPEGRAMPHFPDATHPDEGQVSLHEALRQVLYIWKDCEERHNELIQENISDESGDFQASEPMHIDLAFAILKKSIMDLGGEPSPPPAMQMDWIDHDIMDAHPDKVFLFGDNHARDGYGGQAKYMRGHPRAIGIRTKHAPSMHPSAMWTDDTYDDNVRMIDEDIQEALSHNKQIVIPSAGIGTGLARLSENAPNTFAYLQEQLQGLMGNSD